MTFRRWEDDGELAFLLEPDLKESARRPARLCTRCTRSPPPGSRRARPNASRRRTPCSSTSGTPCTTSPAVARTASLYSRAGGGRGGDGPARCRGAPALGGGVRPHHHLRVTVWRRVARFCSPPGRPVRCSLADGVVEHDSEVVVQGREHRVDSCSCCAPPRRPPTPGCRCRSPRSDGSPPRPRRCPSRGRRRRATRWSPCWRGRAAISLWEALDQVGLIERLLPDWERARNRPQRNPVRLHRRPAPR